ncbi:MAG TPA: pirin-like C-terminal cupin domain-containing protein [Polyangia bacterium]
MNPSPLARRIGLVRDLPPPHPGQFGPDHTVVEVITPRQWRDADPFILLMDDRVDGRLLAGPHPHAGFETVTFIVEGDLPAEHAGTAALGTGDLEWTTAGSGIVHGPDKPFEGKMRVLQLWLTLPKAQRWTEPDHQIVRRKDALVRREGGAEVTLYSGVSGPLVSSTRNRVPVTFIDVALAAGAQVEQQVPGDHGGYLYVLDGEVSVGADRHVLKPGQVGWIDRVEEAAETVLSFVNATDRSARVLFVSGQRQNDPIRWYGPFVGDTQADILRSFERYQAGAFRRV